MSRALFLLLIAPKVLWAQAAASGSITGHVMDETGAPLPSVVAGSALQVGSVSASTNQEGDYQVLDLPAPGVYKVNFTHSGFQTFVRADLSLSVGFAARVDAVMKVGQVFGLLLFMVQCGRPSRPV